MKRLINFYKRVHLLTLFLVVLMLGVSCEDDFTDVGGDFINTLELPEPYVVDNLAAYSDKIVSVQSNTLNTYLLGRYSDDVFGTSESSILSQLQLQTTNPDFGENPVVDSVILTLPLFSQITGVDEDLNKDIYRLDSIFGSGSFKIGVYESNHFLRDIDPGQEGNFEEDQLYYSDGLGQIENNIVLNQPLTVEEDEDGNLVQSDYSPEINPSELINTVVLIDYTNEIETENEDGETETDFERIRLSPRIRIKLDPTFFQQKILDQQGSNSLVSQSSFEDYFRGIYLKAVQQSPEDNAMVNLNLANQDANIRIYYQSDRPAPSLDPDAEPELELTFNEFDLDFGGNIINFYDDSSLLDLSTQDTNSGEENMYIKGGQGIVGVINPFNGPDNDGNGVPDEIDQLRANNWLVNEANIILYVDEEAMQSIPESKQPFRIFAYDLDRDRVLIDYNLDPSASSNPFTSRFNHLGPLSRDNNNEAEVDEDGNLFYKIRITSHINNIINNDSTSTRIGIMMSQNINQTRLLEVKDSQIGEVESCVENSISTPRGTVFHGSNLGTDDEDYDKRLKLQIYYTDPN